ncbi:MAG: glycine/sarcosine/betaine reductase selenoprotein B family protein [Actinomycetota bacterium]
MTAAAETTVGAPARAMSTAHRNYVSYIDKSREYYAAHGYEKPYRWASNETAPFTPLPKPLADCTVGVVTTSGIHQEDKPADAPPPLPKRPFARETASAPNRMFTDDLSWDKQATHTNDTESFLPLQRLREAAAEGRIGRLADRFYGAPTEYSQRRTGEDAATIEQWCREDGVDVVLLIPL